jgi:hypothetical protein
MQFCAQISASLSTATMCPHASSWIRLLEQWHGLLSMFLCFGAGDQEVYGDGRVVME